MSLLKRQKRASSTHHGHQRDKTKWNPTAARRHPSSRLSSLLLSRPRPLSFIHSPFLASTSCYRCLRHFFFFIFPSFLPSLHSLRILHIRFNPRLHLPLSICFFFSFWILSHFLALTTFFFLYLSLSEVLGFRFSRKSKPEENTGTKRDRIAEEGMQTLYTRPKWTVGAQSQPTLFLSRNSWIVPLALCLSAVLNAIFKNASRPGRVIALWLQQPGACAILYGFAFEGRECWTCQRFLWSSQKTRTQLGFLSLCFALSPFFFFFGIFSSFFAVHLLFFFFFARRDLDWSDSFSSSLFLECRHFEILFVFYTAMFQWLLLRGCSWW